LNGKVERSHRVDDQEFYQLLDKNGISDDIRLFNNSCASGRSTTITTARIVGLAGKPRTNALSKRRAQECHRGRETLQNAYPNRRPAHTDRQIKMPPDRTRPRRSLLPEMNEGPQDGRTMHSMMRPSRPLTYRLTR
jgi:hypothetical protein